ncbi:unnamed protein product [Caenorhabditis auriculariae]|uniref:Uncharacterized protein n=1 Tax=Caenorhabditis auriculariae TaxID=2777116 RepID=A0A8S1GTK5_9PELO|nr:unnamed protein product [Caenorhabditis auriculariae]
MIKLVWIVLFFAVASAHVPSSRHHVSRNRRSTINHRNWLTKEQKEAIKDEPAESCTFAKKAFLIMKKETDEEFDDWMTTYNKTCKLWLQQKPFEDIYSRYLMFTWDREFEKANKVYLEGKDLLSDVEKAKVELWASECQQFTRYFLSLGVNPEHCKREVEKFQERVLSDFIKDEFSRIVNDSNEDE